MPLSESEAIVNFGGNVRFTPRYRYMPRNEREVMIILQRHAQDKIRPVGSLHSWSDVIVADKVLVDMRHFNQVEIVREEEQIAVVVGGGCQMEALLDALEKEELTLPTVPNITPQTVAGAISTGTHASGMPSLSHFVEGIRAAAYDPESGEARIYEWTDGPELRAARCALGCMGVILSLRLRCVPRYTMAQRVRRVEKIEEVLAGEEEYPLQSTFLTPYAWSYFSFQRRPIWKLPPITTLRGYLFRFYDLLMIDVVGHAATLAVVNAIDSERLTQWWMKEMVPRIMWRAELHMDDSRQALVRENELFDHLEMELFVPRRHLEASIQLLEEVICVFAGNRERVTAETESQLESIGLLDTLYKGRGSYTYHYLFQIRHVLPDDTLISMSSGGEESYYSISVFTFYQDKSRVYPLVDFLARSMNHLYQARLHWGKCFPLSNEEIEPLYPNLEKFREICNRVDPNGVFRNSYTERVLGF